MNSHSCYRCLAPRCFAIKKAKEVLERVTPRKKGKGEKKEKEKEKEIPKEKKEKPKKKSSEEKGK